MFKVLVIRGTLIVKSNDTEIYQLKLAHTEIDTLESIKATLEGAIERLSDIKPGIVTPIAPTVLTEHPSNVSLYGTIDSTELQALIKDSGYIEPIVVNRLGWVVSGNRRLHAAIELKLESIPVLISDVTPNSAEEIVLLVAGNIGQRKKTALQIAKEVQVWENYYRSTKEDDGEEQESGKTSVKIARRMNISSAQVERAKQMTEAIAIAPESTRSLLNRIADSKSFTTACQLAKLPEEEITTLGRLILANPKIKTVKRAREVQAEKEAQKDDNQVDINRVTAALKRGIQESPATSDGENQATGTHEVKIVFPAHLARLGELLKSAIGDGDFNRAGKIIAKMGEIKKTLELESIK